MAIECVSHRNYRPFDALLIFCFDPTLIVGLFGNLVNGFEKCKNMPIDRDSVKEFLTRVSCKTRLRSNKEAIANLRITNLNFKNLKMSIECQLVRKTFESTKMV